MKTLFTCLLMLGLLTACQHENQSKTMPQETTVETSRFKYRVIALRP